MTNQKKFEHSVNVLLKAFLNDTLIHGNCYACAVGNLIADGLCTNVVKKHNGLKGLVWDNGESYPGGDNWEFNLNGWGAVFSTNRNGGKKKQEINTKYLKSSRAQKQIYVTGYTWQELARIEKAFESADMRRKDKMFHGLILVVDVLAEIHEIDLTTVKETKELFV